MKIQSRSGFTLIEMLTVMLIIAVLAGLILSINRSVQYKAAKSRAEAEIAALSAASENYKADNGTYPRDGAPDLSTDLLDPRKNLVPSESIYLKASLYLYKALSGDADANSLVDTDAKSYYEFKPDVLSATKINGKIERKPGSVKYIQDPWGNCYGYSTANAKQEEDFQNELRKDAAAKRPTTSKGFNPGFDLWSSGGATSGSGTTSGSTLDSVVNKWVKNW